MNKILLYSAVVLYLIFGGRNLSAQITQACDPRANQLANPQITTANPNLSMCVGEVGSAGFRFANAGDDPIPANTIFIDISTSDDTEFEFVSPYVIEGCGIWTVDLNNTTTDLIRLINTGGNIADGTGCDITIAILPKIKDVLQIYSVAVNRFSGASSTCVGDADATASNNTKNAQLLATKVLPIKLHQFTAYPYGEYVILDWKSELEDNFSHFEVERSEDGLSYQQIGVREGIGSNATYNFIDESPINGLNYYRLKMKDYDKSFIYSEIKAVDMSNRIIKQVDFFPNPFSSGFTLTGADKGASLKIFDSKGALIYQQTVTDFISRIELPNITGGIYNAILITDRETISKKIIKIE